MTLLARTAPSLAALLLITAACDGPVETDGGVDASIDAGPSIDAQAFPDGTVFCEVDEDCDDGTACTSDSCGGNGTCSFRVDNAMCDDGVFCNGVEQCRPGLGCVAGSRQTCNDSDVCTVDRCDEDSKTCLHFDRDLDEDGDPDWFCAGGGDCDDTNPLVSSMVSEVCSDGLDNDCDEVIDEDECGAPRFDTCDDPLDVSAGGLYVLDTDGAAPDYTLSCRSTNRDMVATFTLTEARSVTIEAQGEFFTVGISLRSTCTDAGSEIDCRSGYPGIIRRRSLAAGTYFVVVAASSTGEIELDVEFGPPIDPATNDTCGSPVDVSAGGRFEGSFIEVADDYDTTCSISSDPDLAYVFTTTASQDVEITAQTATGARLSYSVRTTCDTDASQIRCAYGSPATGTLHELPAGTYYILLEGPASSAADFTLDVTLSAPTPAPAGDNCGNAIALSSGTPAVGTLVDKENDVEASCGFRYRDAIYSFTLASAADVTLDLDTGSFAYMALRTTCGDAATEQRCTSGNPVYQSYRGLAAGTYYVVVESSTASGFSLRYEATTPPSTPVEVIGNESCATPHVIGASGGLFHGNTTTMANDIAGTSCGSGAASADAVYQLDLSTTRRVILSTAGSAYDTVLHVHRGSCADGGDIHCNDNQDFTTSTSFLDRTLTAGTYYVVVDGWGSSSVGEYYLEVELLDP